MPRTNSTRRDIEGVIGADGKPHIDLVVVDPATHLTGVVVDTGFNGAFCIPEGTLARWGRGDQTEVVRVAVADGSVLSRVSGIVDVLWLGERRTVRAIELGHRFLIGMGLLTGTTLTIDAETIRISRVNRRRATKTATDA